ncbi:hypothetical protein TELCIR_18200, partial [Teladorsagia circumcincta]
AISGGAACSFKADDATGLLNQVPSVQQLIYYADGNGGIYCGMSYSTTTASTETTTELPTTAPESTTTTFEPMTTTSLPDALRFDILFLIGVSKESKTRLDDVWVWDYDGNSALQMNRFVASVMSAYEVSQRNARVALIAVGSGEVDCDVRLYRFDDDPLRIVEEILNNGTYGIITVGYGPLVSNQTALQ